MTRRPVPRLQPGAKVAVVAPSGPVPPEDFQAGLERLQSRYTITYDRGIMSREGFLAGSDERRFEELGQAICLPDVEAIFCARGGYGLLRLLPRLSRLVGPFRERPKPIVGFSDVTLLLDWAVHATGIRAAHGPVVTQLGRLPDDDVAALWSLLEDDLPPSPLKGLRTLVPGISSGTLVGGNLEMLSRLCGTPYQPKFWGKVVLLEDVGERPYRLDRSLTQMRLAGLFDGAAAVVLGEFTRCDEPADAWPGLPSPTAEEVVVERLGSLGIPIVAGLPIGHGNSNRAVPLGAAVTVEAPAITPSAAAVSEVHLVTAEMPPSLENHRFVAAQLRFDEGLVYDASGG